MSPETHDIDCIQLSSGISFFGGTIALIVNSVYWVELSDIGWSYAGSIVWSSVALTLSVVAALHVVSSRVTRYVMTLTGSSL